MTEPAASVATAAIDGDAGDENARLNFEGAPSPTAVTYDQARNSREDDTTPERMNEASRGG